MKIDNQLARNFSLLNTPEKRIAIAIAVFVEEAVSHGVDFQLAVQIAIPAVQEIYYPSAHQLMIVYNLLNRFWIHGEQFAAALGETNSNL